MKNVLNRKMINFVGIINDSLYLYIKVFYMSTAEQRKIKDIANRLLKENRSKDQIIKTLKNAGIVDKGGKIKSPYNQVLVQK
jgi:hypothetical protein